MITGVGIFLSSILGLHCTINFIFFPSNFQFFYFHLRPSGKGGVNFVIAF